MSAIRRFIKTVPASAFTLVFLVIVVNIIYLINMDRMIFTGIGFEVVEDHFVISSVATDSPAEKAGLRTGDIIMAVNSIPIKEPAQLDFGVNLNSIPDQIHPGDTAIIELSRNEEKYSVTLIPGSFMRELPAFFYFKYLIIILFSLASLYILVKKSGDRSAQIFFIFFQFYSITQIAYTLDFLSLIANLASVVFLYSVFLSGAALIHFTLVFPKQARIYDRFRFLPSVIYSITLLISTSFILLHLLAIYHSSPKYYYTYVSVNRIVVTWILATFLIAMAMALYQFRTAWNTLHRNQLRMVILGAFFGYSAPMAYAFFYDSLLNVNIKYPFLFYDVAQEITTFLMIVFFLVAIFRYRIWDISIIIRKGLQYSAASLFIILMYLLIVFLLNSLITNETDLIRFLAFAVSVIIFLILRDRLQNLLDRLFQRERYDSAAVVAEFEEGVAGAFRIEDLGNSILDGMDRIFHFKSVLLCLKKEEKSYEAMFIKGIDKMNSSGRFLIPAEFENKLLKSNVFSPGELAKTPELPGAEQVDLVVPMIKDGKPFGFFLCGPKKSEKSYSLQDIRVLSLIANRVIALFQTAYLYQKDLDRQLMLERERARISQDMHDDVGASLTRISMMSDLVKNMPDTGENARHWLGQISGTSRNVMEEMNQIIWALNPKNDNLEGLVAYVRRFAFNYLEPARVECEFDLPEEIPDLALSVEIRRNVYLVVREALHNVVKHSGSNKVLILLKIEENCFRIIVKDDGKGFDPEKLEFPGNGLVNMKKRMMDIGGKIVIRSKTGEGTEIEITCFI